MNGVRPTAKRIVLEVLSAATNHEAQAAGLIEAAALLGVGESAVRVTLTRLVASGVLEIEGRGLYRLGRAAQGVTRQVTGWRDLEKQVRRWDGGWAAVAPKTGRDRARDLDRRDAAKTARALRFLGFRPLEPGFELRPDNLDGGVDALRARLRSLGLPDDVLVFGASRFDPQTEARARALWDAERLDASYVHTKERIERWLVSAADLDPRAAAREVFFFGGDVVRQILFDPRLPEPLVDVAARRAMVEAARRLDAHGRRVWSRLFGLPKGLQVLDASA